MKVLVARLDHVGDMLLTTPLLRSVAKAGHEVDVVANPEALETLERNPHVAGRFSIKDICNQFPRHWPALAKWMRSRNYDTILLPHARPKELLWASFRSGAGLRVAMWSGVWGRLTLHRCLRSGLPENPRHMSDMVLDCARAIGAAPDGLKPDFLPAPGAREWAAKAIEDRLGRPGRIVGIHPGCMGNTCNLTPSEYGKIAAGILRHAGTAVIVTGSAKERYLLADWPAEATSSPRLWNSMGETSLSQLAALVEQMAVYVVPGTAPLHLASCVGATTVSPICAWPPLSEKVWGNLAGIGIAVKPPLDYCLSYRRGHRGNCDFSGRVTAEQVCLKVAEAAGLAVSGRP